MPIVPGLEFPELCLVRVGQVQIAAQHRHVQIPLPEHPAHIGGQALRQGGVVKAHILDALGKGQVHTPEALFPRGGGPGLQGLQRLRRRGVYIVQTDS